MPPQQRLSIICLALGRITIEGRYLLVANPAQYRKSGGQERIWESPNDTPEILPHEMHHLMRMLDARTQDGIARLRFSVPKENLAKAMDWFALRDPDPEAAREALVHYLASSAWDGTPLLLHPGISEAEVVYAGRATAAITQPRPGPHPRQKTHYFLWVCDLHPQQKAYAAIDHILTRPNSPFKLVSNTEIADGRTTDGEKISALTRHLLWV